MSIFEKLSGKSWCGPPEQKNRRRVPFFSMANMLRMGFLLKVLAACNPTPQELPPTGSLKSPITLGSPLVSPFSKAVNIETVLNGKVVTPSSGGAKLHLVTGVNGKHLPGRTRMTFANLDPNTGLKDIRRAELAIDAKIDLNDRANSSATVTIEGINNNGVVDIVAGLADPNTDEYEALEQYGFGGRKDKDILNKSTINSAVNITEGGDPRWTTGVPRECQEGPISIHPSSKPGVLRVVVDMHYPGQPQQGADIFLVDIRQPNWCQELIDRIAATKDPMSNLTTPAKLKAAGVMDPLSDPGKEELEAPESQDGLLQGVTTDENGVDVTRLNYQGKLLTYNSATQIWTAGGTDQDRTIEEGRLTTILRSNTVSDPNATVFMLVFSRYNQQTQGNILTRAILVPIDPDQMGRPRFQMVKITPTPDVQLAPDYDGDQRRGAADGCPVLPNPAENGAGIDINKDGVDDSCNVGGFSPNGPRNGSNLIKVTPELSESGGNKFTHAFATENGSTFQSNQDVKLDPNGAILAQGGQILRAIHSSSKDTALKIRVPQGYGLKIQVNSVKHLDGNPGKGELSLHEWNKMMMDPNSPPTKIPLNAPTGLVDYGYVGGGNQVNQVYDDGAGVEGSDLYIEIYGPYKLPPWIQPQPDLAEQPKDGGVDLMQPPPQDAGIDGSQDLSMPQQGSPDMAKSDLAERPDMAVKPDLAEPPPDLASNPEDLTMCPADGGRGTMMVCQCVKHSTGGPDAGPDASEVITMGTPILNSDPESGENDGCGCKVGGKHENSESGPLKALALAGLLLMASPRRRKGIGGMIDRGREALARVFRIG